MPVIGYSKRHILKCNDCIICIFWLILVQVCLHEPVEAVARGLFYIKMSGGGEGGREALVLLFLSLSRPSHLYLSHSVIEWDLCCWLYEYKTRLLQWGVKAIYSTQILLSGMFGDTGKSVFLSIVMFYVCCFGMFTCASKENNIL